MNGHEKEKKMELNSISSILLDDLFEDVKESWEPRHVDPERRVVIIFDFGLTWRTNHLKHF